MEPIYSEQFKITQPAVDCFGRLKPGWILYLAQQVAGVHSSRLGVSLTTADQRELFWAVIRHRVQITRLPREGETVTVETWPLPATRTAYPRSTIARDEKGQEVFRSVSLWVLMDRRSRGLVVPGKSGVEVPGLLRGNELAVPANLPPAQAEQNITRSVGFTDLDVNGHMNNTRYMDWVWDLLPSSFHREHPVKDFTVCYLSEALEGEALTLNWGLEEGPNLRLEAHRTGAADRERVFSARVIFD